MTPPKDDGVWTNAHEYVAIPAARLAAMERAVEALREIAKDCWSHVEGCKFKFAPVDECPNPKCGAREIARASLARLEAAR